jgi:phosphatidate cytidylyltransferase
VADADPAHRVAARPPSSELALRVGSGLVLAPLAVAVAYLGGWPFTLFWGVAAGVVLWEWTTLVTQARQGAPLMVGLGALLLAVALAAAGMLAGAVIVLALGTVAVGALAPKPCRLWAAGGVPYAGAIGIAPMVLRADGDYGFVAIILLFAVVWSTDIVAYFVGRALGGPKLLPAVSPKKTWSGAFGGLAGAVVAALVTARFAGLSDWLAIAVLAVALSVIAQAGDLFESFLKRRFGVKDSGYLIPGHGGLMDRLDGFVTAAALAALIGVMRGGLWGPARGLVVW